MHWMHKLSSFLLLFSLLGQASSVLMLRSCQQGGKYSPALCIVCCEGVFPFAEGEEGDLPPEGWETLTLASLWLSGNH